VLATPPGLTFSAYALEVNDMVDHGATLTEVEGAVCDAELTEDSKAALWLLAWSSPRGGDGRPAPTRRANPPWPATSVSGGRVPPLMWR
jgi:hypothetical protein